MAEAGHQVTATFTRESVEAYPEAGFARARVQMLQPYITPIWQASMGNEAFFAALEAQPWDAICLHASFVSNHKAADFPVLEAVHNNTRGIERIVEHLASQGAPPIIWTGTYFEAGEGQGSQPLRNFSPYALSKQLSWEYIRFYCEQVGLPIRKFAMPNPFGPWEGKGFTSYLAKTWLAGNVAEVKTPDYIRDNAPVDLLAQTYVQYVSSIVHGSAQTTCSPSFYAGTQRDFALRFAEELKPRLGVDCALTFAEQVQFDEPKERLNCEKSSMSGLVWNEVAFWGALAVWYHSQYCSKMTS